jgi:hypothetical protein
MTIEGQTTSLGGTNAVAATATAFTATPSPPASVGTYTMQGVGVVITPARSGVILINMTSLVDSTSGTAGNGISCRLYQNAGSSVPANGATLVGTVVGSTSLQQIYLNPTTVTAADVAVPFNFSGVVLSGLTPGTAYWIDAACTEVGGSGAAIARVNFTAWER